MLLKSGKQDRLQNYADFIKSVIFYCFFFLLTFKMMPVRANEDMLKLPEMYLSDLDFSEKKNILLVNSENDKSNENPFFERNELTSNWWGLRDFLIKHGIKPEFEYINNDFQKLSGGKNKENTLVAQSLTSVGLELDTEKIHLWKGGTLYAMFQNNVGKSITIDYIGDLQFVNNLDAQPFSQFTQYWYKQKFFSDKFRIKVGIGTLKLEAKL